MTKHDYPRLCGGTFFILVLQALRQRFGAREHYAGDGDGLTDPEVLAGLIKVINPDYKDPGKEKLKGTANNYKACKSSKGTYLPFDDEQVLSAFNNNVQTNYPAVLNGMTKFVKGFLELGPAVHKDTNLVRALIDLILQDQSINPNEEFFIGESGERVKKSTLGDLQKVCLPSFLLGVWHYVVIYRKDNSVGKDTYDKWCPAQDRAQRRYTAHMGEGLFPNLSSYMVEAENIPTADSETDEPIIIDPVPEQQVQQTVNNPLVFNFNQYGSNGTQIGHIENYYGGKKKEH